MRKILVLALSVCGLLISTSTVYSQQFKLNSSGYFQDRGVDVMAFADIYPEGHQGGVALIMHGHRVGTNGDLRFEPTPGQWQPLPKQKNRVADEATNTIKAYMAYPDSSKHLTGFNPMIYPDLVLNYEVTVKGVGNSIVVTVDLDRPIPQEFVGKMGFNFELFPGWLFGKSWIMDGQTGIFPQQPNGPTLAQEPNINHSTKMEFNARGKASAEHLVGKGYSPIVADDIVSEPYAIGKKFTVQPEDPYYRFTIETKGTDLKLYDGRMNHNNGWFVVRSEVPAGKTKGAIEWVITPNVVDSWLYQPVVQTSQIGYHPNQPKVAIIELDNRDTKVAKPALYKIGENGEELAFTADAQSWGKFLRYNYLKFDFTSVKGEGLYKVKYADSESSVFRIAKNVYDRGVWQPVLEYFLPVQMCHMRVNEKYRVWHDACHMDDALMAPTDFNHIDGYAQGSSTLTHYHSGDHVPGINIGGWHDAGDFDLRVESQAGESYILAMAYESFNVNYDATDINQITRITEIHQPDGKADMLQQVENGMLSVVGSYRALGRLYRGIICNGLRQYAMLGDASAMTDNLIGNDDDRWVFTENNPGRELSTAAAMAASARVLRGFNDTLSTQALEAARMIFAQYRDQNNMRLVGGLIQAAAELYLATSEDQYKNYLLDNTEYIGNAASRVGWYLGRVDKKLGNKKFTETLRKGLVTFSEQVNRQGAETPYGVPYRPSIWGAGWDIQSFGYRHYFLHKSYPDIFSADIVYNALNFILGCHPGLNTSSFASGVGAVSATVGYGLNRADWSYIPGGVVSGTALIRPDFPELLVFPFLWQQVEYVLGGGSSHYMFLVLAAQQLLNE
ncbi:MAG: glycoside hydrolase family 9 protein [Prevotellaceae bacterium]|jgi:hypothetical protein|nr:glycoside hydrolase family 9 protein [Prevotellaceae bacterium]